MKKEIDFKDNLLEVRNLSKFFTHRGGINMAVDDVSFRVAKGEIIGLIGQSGSGKSTIASAVTRLEKEINGTITLDGKVVSGRISRQRRKEFTKNVQMIFQDPHTSLNEKRNIFSTVSEPLIVNKVINKTVKNFFVGYRQIQQTFHYTFVEAYKKESVESDEMKGRERKAALHQAIDRLNNFKYENFGKEHFDEAFSELILAYFEPIIMAEEKILAQLVQSSRDLLNTYEVARENVKNLNLPADEAAYVKAQNALKDYISSFDDRKIGIKVKKAKREFKDDEDEQVDEIDKLIRALIKDRKERIKFQRQQGALTSTRQQKRKYTDRIKRLKLELSVLRKFTKDDFFVELEDIYSLDDDVRNSQDPKSLIGFELSKLKSLNKANREDAKKTLDAKIAEASKNKGAHIKPDPKEVDRLKSDLEAAKKEFDRNTDSFLSKFKINYAALLEREAKAKDDVAEIKVLEKEAEKLLDKHFRKILHGVRRSRARNDLKFIVKNKQSLQARLVEQKLVVKQVKQFKYVMGVKRLFWPFDRLIRRFIARNFLLRKAVFDSLVQVGLKPEHAYRYPHEFSGGQKQRINIARALIIQPKLIIADEPIASLDVSIQAQVVNLLIDLVRNKNISMIFIAHDLSIVEYLADSLLVMHMGRFVEKGLANLIYSTPLHPYTKTLLEATPKVSTANEPFKSADVDLSYIADYEFQKPKMVEVEKDHLILANERQVFSWTRELSLRQQETEKAKIREKELEELKTIEMRLVPKNPLPISSPSQLVKPLQAKSNVAELKKPLVESVKPKTKAVSDSQRDVTEDTLPWLINPQSSSAPKAESRAAKEEVPVKATKPKTTSDRSSPVKSLQKSKVSSKTTSPASNKLDRINLPEENYYEVASARSKGQSLRALRSVSPRTKRVKRQAKKW